MKNALITVFILVILFSCSKVVTVDQLLKKNEPSLFLHEYYEGDFTNSGSKEVVAFFQDRRAMTIEDQPISDIDRTFYYNIEKGKKITSRIEIPFYTVEYDDGNNLDDMNLEDIGRRIAYGCVGDFNNNGKEELYLYHLSGSAFYPECFEFDGKSFRRLFTFTPFSAAPVITGADKATRTIQVRNADGNDDIGYGDTYTLSWNEASQSYDAKKNP